MRRGLHASQPSNPAAVPSVPCTDFSGQVLRVGPSVTKVAVGDYVAGFGRSCAAHFCVAPGTNVQQAIESSSILQEVVDIDLTVCRVGVYGKLKPLDSLLRDQDRIEIYRPLLADPKESRRQRAEKKAGKKTVLNTPQD